MSRIKVAIGDVQIEYEGDQDFIETKITTLAEELIALRERLPVQDREVVTSSNFSQIQSELSTNTIAQIFGAKTGTDLVLAAVARINIIRCQPVASRQEILEEMREASTYFKETFASNLTAYLSTLVRTKRINLVSKSNYALAAGERNRIAQMLASDV